jgi:hypothetical protein
VRVSDFGSEVQGSGQFPGKAAQQIGKIKNVQQLMIPTTTNSSMVDKGIFLQAEKL